MIYRLLVKTQQGDEKAMLELINRFQPLVCGEYSDEKAYGCGCGCGKLYR